MEAVGADEVAAARERIRGLVLRTPLVPLPSDVLKEAITIRSAVGDGGKVEKEKEEEVKGQVWVKLENLQEVGAFKQRGASSALQRLLALPTPPLELVNHGAITASTGNMGQGLAWCCRRAGIKCSVLVPEGAPDNKLQAILRLGATIIKVPYEEWWNTILTHQTAVPGYFIHPVCDKYVMAGNATIGCEILEDLPHVDSVVIPYGGGGLSCGIAAAIKHTKPNVKIFAAEVSTAAPVRAAFENGAPIEINTQPSFVDGIGSKCVIKEMWPLAKSLLDGSLVATPAEAAAAIKMLAERKKVISEGAGGCAVACAIKRAAETGETVACVVSGGGIDMQKLAKCLLGQVPE